MFYELESPRSLPRIAEILTETGFAVHLTEPTHDAPLSQLLVALDEVELDVIQLPMRLFYQEDALILAEPLNSQLVVELEGSATLCFLLELERELPTKRLLDLYRLLNLWTGILPLGTLGVQESSPSSVVYRYSLPHDDSFNRTLVAEILDQAGFYLNRVVPLLDRWLRDGGDILEVIQESERNLASEALAMLERESGLRD